MIFLYHLLWTAICFPWLFELGAFSRKRRIRERLSLTIPEAELPQGNIWVHALSVGEVISALPLINSLKARYPNKGIVFTCTTVQGMELAKKELKGNVTALLHMPFDFWWSMRRIIDYIKPSVFILVETDIWPGVVHSLARRGIRSVLVNGRISPSTFASYKKFPFVPKILFKDLEICLMQSELDSQRLIQIGISPYKVRTIGNIKFDRQWTPMEKKEREKWISLFGFREDNIIWVAGSTHDEESDIILRTFARLKQNHSTVRLVIAPRRVEEAKDILAKSVNMGMETVLRSRLNGNKSPEVVVLDTIGELERVYGLARISFVGGSLVPKGGHNLLEPASFGTPVLFGPYTDNFVFMSQALIEAGGGIRVKDETELLDVIEQLLSNPRSIEEAGIQAKKFIYSNQGAINTVIQYIDKCLSGVEVIG